MHSAIKYICFSLLLLSVSACVTRTVWYKDGASQLDFSQDTSACDAVPPMLSDVIGTGFIGAANLRRYYDRCMTERGWFTREEKVACLPDWCGS